MIRIGLLAVFLVVFTFQGKTQGKVIKLKISPKDGGNRIKSNTAGEKLIKEEAKKPAKNYIILVFTLKNVIKQYSAKELQNQ